MDDQHIHSNLTPNFKIIPKLIGYLMGVQYVKPFTSCQQKRYSHEKQHFQMAFEKSIDITLSCTTIILKTNVIYIN